MVDLTPTELQVCSCEYQSEARGIGCTEARGLGCAACAPAAAGARTLQATLPTAQHRRQAGSQTGWTVGLRDCCCEAQSAAETGAVVGELPRPSSCMAPGSLGKWRATASVRAMLSG